MGLPRGEEVEDIIPRSPHVASEPLAIHLRFGCLCDELWGDVKADTIDLNSVIVPIILHLQRDCGRSLVGVT